MHDIKAIRDDPKAFDEAMKRRNMPDCADMIASRDRQIRGQITREQEQKTRKKDLSKKIGQYLHDGNNSAAQALQVNVKSIDSELAAIEKHLPGLECDLRKVLDWLPNRLADDVPSGSNETGNTEQKRTGDVVDLGFPARQHFELGEALGQMDFEAAARIAGARFTVLRGGLARLERALGQFMLDLHTTQHGYTETTVPGLVNDAAFYGTGQLPKFAEDSFKTTDGRWLIPTAEVPLTNTVAGQILPAAALPLRLCALTDCYRSEAGSAGRDTRGMLRQHQFRKVELVSIVTPETSDAEHERMTRAAEAVLTALGLTWRRMLLCAGDTGFSAAKTYDLEVWLPGQKMWREISSCSTCRDFQARRMNARYRGPDGKPAFVHTLNGSGVAVGRALIAVMETFQREDGSIDIPPVLHHYMGGTTRIASR